MKCFHKGVERPDGRYGALCSDKSPPSAINLRIASYTLNDERVTCVKCRTILMAEGKVGRRDSTIAPARSKIRAGGPGRDAFIRREGRVMRARRAMDNPAKGKG